MLCCAVLCYAMLCHALSCYEVGVELDPAEAAARAEERARAAADKAAERQARLALFAGSSVLASTFLIWFFAGSPRG